MKIIGTILIAGGIIAGLAVSIWGSAFNGIIGALFFIAAGSMLISKSKAKANAAAKPDPAQEPALADQTPMEDSEEK